MLDFYINKGLEIGLNKEDYIYIKRNILNVSIHEQEILMQLMDLLFEKGVLNRYSYETIKYLRQNCMLAPLVLANNTFPKVKLIFQDSLMFLCQFHEEKRPSFSVRDWENYGHCLGCKKTVDAITYLKDYHNIKYARAVKLLANIYLINIGEYFYDIELIKEYQNTITSIEYEQFMNESFERMIEKYGFADDIINKHKDRVETIKRIKENKYDEQFTLIPPVKKYILTKSDVKNLYDNAKKIEY